MSNFGTEPNPVGRVVDDFVVTGVERDGHERWVGSDMMLRIRSTGNYFLTVVTKNYFADNQISRILDDIDQATPAELGADSPRVRQPFVLNDDEITDEILERKFKGRVVETDLAASLWYSGESET